VAVEFLVGLNVTDAAGYERYRSGVATLLKEHGGEFGQDFEVARVLRTDAEHPVTRVFTLRFPDESAREAFFGDPECRAVREAHFEPAVAGATIFASWDR
jgi:uncharacterized protein (DUF1330 family)